MTPLTRPLAALCAAALLLTAPALPAGAAEPAPTNLLAADMDTGFDGGTSSLTLSNPSSGGTQKIVDLGGDNALELRDASLGANLSSYFYRRWSTGTLKDRINAVYREPVGSPAQQFILRYDLRRSAASDKPVAKDIYAQIQFGNFDDKLVPRFPVPAVSVTTTSAYTGTSGSLSPVDETDIPQYRFTIVPNGGQRLISTVELGFSVRVDTGGTDEAITIDNLGVYEAGSVSDSSPPTAPTALTRGAVSSSGVSLSWTASTDDVGVTGYDVYRDGYQAASVSGGVTTAVVGGLMPATSYEFTVRAKDASGNVSAPSAPLTVSTGPYVPEAPAPFPGTPETRSAWLWNKTKAMKEESGPVNVAQYTAQLADHENVTANLAKLDTLFQSYDYEQYKTMAKMYAYLIVGDQFSDTMRAHARGYFASYAYQKLNQTENLRMSNYATGYLVGQYFPDLADLNGNSGEKLKSINKANILDMVNAGVRRGWAEYQSPEYTFMTYFCLNALYQWADDPDLRQRVKMAMDVMWFEWANDWIDGYMISSESRAKGDLAAVNDPTWRPADHSTLAWTYFGGHRTQQGVGESDNPAPAAYRPNLEYAGLAAWKGMTYEPPQLAVSIGRRTDKSYTSRKANLQNSGGHAMDIYRTTYVRPTWGLGTEIQYRRADNWLEDLPVVLRWHADAADPLFRLSVDQGNAPIGAYDQPADHRVMQHGPTAVGVYRSSGDQNHNFVNALFPTSGSIRERRDTGGWTVADTGTMYFAYKLVKPAKWYHQTPNDPANKVKTTAQTHPTAGLSYSYDILRSQADRNGWVLETADASAYPDLDAFASALTRDTRLDAGHIDDPNPRLTYHSLSGDDLDITFDAASQAPGATHLVNGKAIDYDSFPLFDTPWLRQDKLGSTFTASAGGSSVVYDFDHWTVTSPDDGAKTVPAAATLSSDNGWDTGLLDGDHTVSMDLWWGENATQFRLYENGTLVDATPLTADSPKAQHAAVKISGRRDGTYVYTGELINSKGIRTVDPLQVTVRDASPGTPQLSADNKDHDGAFTVRADLWWGTNATRYRFFENGAQVSQGDLTAATPKAQQASLAVTGRPAGTYEYVAEFTNDLGSTRSAPLKVVVG
ncbi:fibronectin type III domain-containing protein [Nonomuraea pusilla]|uniref:Chitodextrinase n=1 Tax=Nonomuraea pusilla TaxID=46177 RepID=A0A1H7YF77_9ACTN|nr:fibronectin type III domain-containing protein [Nonomuraea pusilla]SEM44760.1 Chitodextrinase [Nonomuraea pusilla]